MEKVNLKIGSRFVRKDKDGLRLFQKQAFEVVKDSTAGLIFVEGMCTTAFFS
jgi:hypothetical protein